MPRRRVRRVPPVRYGSREQVWSGHARMTRGFLTKDNLYKKRGNILTKTRLAQCRRRRNNNLLEWTTCILKARGDLGITGFCAVAKGGPLYYRARHLYDNYLQGVYRCRCPACFEMGQIFRESDSEAGISGCE